MDSSTEIAVLITEPCFWRYDIKVRSSRERGKLSLQVTHSASASCYHHQVEDWVLLFGHHSTLLRLHHLRL
jgi:hypothetical protein